MPRLHCAPTGRTPNKEGPIEGADSPQTRGDAHHGNGKEHQSRNKRRLLHGRFLSSQFERTDGVIVRGEIVKDDKGIGLRLLDLTFDRHVCSLLLSSTNG